MPEEVGAKGNGPQKHARARFGVLLRPLVTALLHPLKWLFRVLNRRQRAKLAAIPGIQAIYRSLLPLFLPKPAEDGTICAIVNGLRMCLDYEDNGGGLSAYLSGEYEPGTTAFVAAVLSPGDTVIDVALIGVTSLFLRRPSAASVAGSSPSSLTLETLSCSRRT